MSVKGEGHRVLTRFLWQVIEMASSGIGFGSASEIAGAVGKSIADAKKNLIRVPLKDGTLPHEIICEFKSAKVLLKPGKTRYRYHCRTRDARNFGIRWCQGCTNKMPLFQKRQEYR